MKSDSRDGRGLLTARSDEENQSRLKEDLKHQESEVNLRRDRDEMHDWYLEALNSYEEELNEERIQNMNAELNP